MFKIALKQIFKDYKTILAIFVALLATSIFVSSFADLIGTAIHQVLPSYHSKLKDPKGPLMIFNIVGGLIAFIAIVVISMLVNQSIKRRSVWFTKLRIIGATYKQMRNLVLLENIMLLLIAFAIGAPLALPLISFINQYMINNHAIDPAFVSEKNIIYFAIGFGFALIITLLVSIISTRGFKNISTSTKVESKKARIWKLVIGCAMLIGGIAMILIKPIMQGGMGSGMVLNAMLLIVISFVFLGKYLFSGLMKVLIKLFKNPTIQMPLKSLKFSGSAILQPIGMAIAGITMTIYAIDVAGILDKAVAEKTEEIYKNVQSGTNLLKDETDLNKYQDVINKYSETGKDMTVISNQFNNFFVKEDKLDNFLVGNAVGGNAMLPNYQKLSGSYDQFIGPNRIKNSIIVASTSHFFVGEHINMRMNKNASYTEFTVVATYKMPLRFSTFPDMMINIEDALAMTLDSEKPMTLFSIISNDKYLEKFYSTNVQYDPIAQATNQFQTSQAISLMFAIIFATYISITLINSFAIYASDKKKEFKLLRTVSHTYKDIWKSIIVETFVTTIITVLTSLIISFGINIGYSAANEMQHIVFTLSPLFLSSIVLFAIAIIFGSIFIPMLAMRRELKEIKRN